MKTRDDTGNIFLIYEVECHHCEQYENLPYSTRKAFVKHLEDSGWRKYKGRWHCEFCFNKVLKDA